MLKNKILMWKMDEWTNKQHLVDVMEQGVAIMQTQKHSWKKTIVL